MLKVNLDAPYLHAASFKLTDSLSLNLAHFTLKQLVSRRPKLKAVVTVLVLNLAGKAR